MFWAFLQHLLFFLISLKDKQDFQCYFSLEQQATGLSYTLSLSLPLLSTFQSSPFEALQATQPRETWLSSLPFCFLFFFLSTNAFSYCHNVTVNFPGLKKLWRSACRERRWNPSLKILICDVLILLSKFKSWHLNTARVIRDILTKYSEFFSYI